MSAPITESHRELARNIMFYHTPEGSATAQGVRDAAQLIADSEAKACEQLRNEFAAEREKCDKLLTQLQIITDFAANPDVREVAHVSAELASERARLDWLDENAGDIHRYNSNRYIFIFNQDLRAAIDAAMKEGA